MMEVFGLCKLVVLLETEPRGENIELLWVHVEEVLANLVAMLSRMEEQVHLEEHLLWLSDLLWRKARFLTQAPMAV